MYKNEIKINDLYLWIDRVNFSYIKNIYEQFLINPKSIDSSWYPILNLLKKENKIFNNFESTVEKNNLLNIQSIKQTKCINKNILIKEKIDLLILSFKEYGHLYSNIDPMKFFSKNKKRSLEIKSYNFSDQDLYLEKYHNYFPKYYSNCKNIFELYQNLLKKYCNFIGFEYMHINSDKEKNWIDKKINNHNQYLTSLDILKKKNILKMLIKSESLEQFINSTFPGSKRFSLEGLESLLPMLNEIIFFNSNKIKISKVIIGMAHRGRLNILVNILGKKLKELFFEFSENYHQTVNSGDVKYHLGKNIEISVNKNNKIYCSLKPNPSHLEIIHPFVMGSARATIENLENKKFDEYQTIPIAIHGDASISGQGIIQETLNMSQTDAYYVGGTIHIVLNNQIGFTTSKKSDLRSSTYCTDIGKMIQSPIFHVNSDDPESVIFVTQLALEYRNCFHKDVFIDLVGYRRHGHNEIDDPVVTQPLMYKKISNHPSVIKIFFEKLKKQKIIDEKEKNIFILEYNKQLKSAFNESFKLFPKNKNQLSIKQDQNNNKIYNKININKLKKLALLINTIPSTMSVHNRVKKIYDLRKKMSLEQIPFDWGASESLAYAVILKNGISCRISGEDTQRGTFFHRHAVIHDQNNGNTYIPLEHVDVNQGKLSIYNSVLSETSTLAFEYGYSTSKKNSITIWEAQFGDFVNMAQVIIDQFISSSEQKWGYNSNLIMYLPHGYEGQGPEHSSARIERFLQLCAKNNMQICIPTTASQMYNLLIRQVFDNIKKPLIIMTPKSLLRHPLSKSSLQDLFYGKFNKIIIDQYHQNKNLEIKKIIFCTGKIYYDLRSFEIKNNIQNTIICRMEQLYPFPMIEIKKFLDNFLKIKQIIWCQEEPENQGAWQYIQSCFKKYIFSNNSNLITFIGRAESASTAVGYLYIHRHEQEKIIKNVFSI